MSDDLILNVTSLRSNAQTERRKARDAADPAERERLFGAAAKLFQKAIDDLERGLRRTRQQESGYTENVCRVLEALSQTYGSLGGTWRDAGKRELALAKYDRGSEYENERRTQCHASDSYNMLQRLIVKLLLEPQRLEDAGFRAELLAARDMIESQKESRKDSWFLADRALVSFLCGAEADDAIARIEADRAETTFYESTYNAIKALVAEGLGQGTPLADRLEGFMRLLQRKGGISS